jgi:charged multivesicular body protein 4
LEELEQEELDAKMLETPSPVVSAPNVPNHMPGKSINAIIAVVEWGILTIVFI